MRLLLDTHVVLWAFADPGRLSGRQRRAIEKSEQVSVSSITLAEIAIKSALGKLRTPADLPDRIEEAGFQHAGFRHDHAWRMGQLPKFHGDPFDRMLIAQAQTDGLTLVTADEQIMRYDVALLGP